MKGGVDGRWLTVANGVTFFRLGLLVVFVGAVVVGEWAAAVTLFFLAWALDGVDGWIARSREEASELGSLIDKVSDRTILGVGLLVFLVYEYVPWYAVFLATKDMVLLPLLVTRQGRFWETDWSVGWGGKLLTVLQGAGLVWLGLGLPGPKAVVGLVAVVGFLVGVATLRRERRDSGQLV